MTHSLPETQPTSGHPAAGVTPSGHPTAAPSSARLEDPDDLFPPSPNDADLLPPQPTEASITKRVVYLSIGILLLLIGTVLWITPIIGGAPLFWIPGLVLLAKASDSIRKVINAGDRKLPGKLRKILRWARDKTSRMSGGGTITAPVTSDAPGATTLPKEAPAAPEAGATAPCTCTPASVQPAADASDATTPTERPS